MLPVVILAGGLATRLYPVTRTIPKSLININGIPFISHQLSLLREKGVHNIVISVGQFGDQIEEYVRDGSQFGLSVRYSYDGEILLGTGGAVKKATPLLPEAFFILYGDSYLDIDYEAIEREYYLRDAPPLLMTVYHNYNAFDSSNILMKNERILKYDKTDQDSSMEYIDYGLMVIRKEAVGRYSGESPFDLSNLLTATVNNGLAVGYLVTKRFYEIGSPQGIQDTEEYIRNRTPRYLSE
ncbi:MAG TPA: sugar phosphate nucleotidyltransferase [Methanospirillum sp.]|nr:sugar phosphate nucleotidyltransferase [Methanospirillum sp.]